eukprot:9329244-Pyramimonas_sp.AAC.1
MEGIKEEGRRDEGGLEERGGGETGLCPEGPDASCCRPRCAQRQRAPLGGCCCAATARAHRRRGVPRG